MPTISRSLRIALGLFVLGFLSAALQLGDDAGLGRAFETVTVARHLAAGDGFSSPYDALATGPTTLVPPVHPAIMAGVLRLFGDGAAFTVALVLLQFILNGIQAALLPAVSERLLGQRRPGYFAAGALICLPVMPIMPQFETGLQIVLLLLLVLIPVTARTAIPAALLGALALHTNPSSLFLLVGWMFWKRPGFRWTAIWACTLVLACLPWAIRNHSVTGRFVFIRNNLPLELWLSNNHVAGAGFFDNRLSFKTLHPNYNRAEAESVRQLGESAYFDMCGRHAMEWIRHNPGRFLQLTWERAVLYWFPYREPNRFRSLLVCLLTLLAVPALPRLYRSPVFVAAFLLAPLLYYFVQADYRYRLPYLWLTLLAAGLSASALLERRGTGSARPLRQD